MNAERAIDLCAREVRRHDYDRYLCTMFAEPSARHRLYALYAFNLELARIPELVSEPALGEIRLQWWRDTVDGVYRDTPRDHPVAQALATTGMARVLQRPAIEALIDARARDLDETPIPDRDALITYADGTSSILLNLALEAMAIRDPDARAAARPLGRAWAITGIIRATGHLARQGRCLVPAAVLQHAGISKSGILRGVVNDGVRRAISEMASWASDELATARRRRTPRAALPVMLMATLTGAYLRRLERAASNPFDAKLTISPLARQVLLLTRAATNRP